MGMIQYACYLCLSITSFIDSNFLMWMTLESYPLTKEKNATMMGMNSDSNNKTLIITTALFYFILLFV